MIKNESKVKKSVRINPMDKLRIPKNLSRKKLIGLLLWVLVVIQAHQDNKQKLKIIIKVKIKNSNKNP